ncbi:MAG: TolC family protein [Planctomycetia bacterium]|nr:TolC family protein [Planctomycetia bacterium]
MQINQTKTRTARILISGCVFFILLFVQNIQGQENASDLKRPSLSGRAIRLNSVDQIPYRQSVSPVSLESNDLPPVKLAAGIRSDIPGTAVFAQAEMVPEPITQKSPDPKSYGTSGSPESQNELWNDLPIPEDIKKNNIHTLPAVNYPGTQAAVPCENLESVWAAAIQMSRQLQAKGYKTDSARNQVRAAQGLALPKLVHNTSAIAFSEQPQLQTDLNLGAVGQMFNLPNQVSTNILDKEFITTTTAITVPIYLGGKVDAMIQSATALSNALQAGERVGEQDLKAETAKVYFLVLRVRKLLQVAKEAETTTAAHMKDAARLYQNGILTKNVVLAAQVAHANAQQDVLKATNSLHLAEAAFNRLLWRPLQNPVEIEDMEIPPLSGPLEPLTAAAIRQRGELNALSSQAQALNAQADVHRSNLLPNVALVGAHNYTEHDSLSPNSNFTGAIGVTWMPFDGGTSRAEQESMKLEAIAVCRLRDDAQTAIELQVYQCWMAEQETRERVSVAETAIQQADENLRVVMRSFQEGLLNHTEVLDAQTLRTQAWTNYAHARYDAILASFNLRRAVGNL